MSKEDIYLYSFDGGKTWQESNKKKVNENSKLEIIVKNKNEIFTSIKNVEIDKIDKEEPKATISKIHATNSKLILEVVAYDDLSGIDSISFNGNDYSERTKYEVTEPGKYYFTIKDIAGNISEKHFVEVNESDLKKESKKYTVTLKENGAIVEKKDISCSTISDSCEIVLPNIITNGTALGWATSSDTINVSYKEGQTIKLTKDLTLYAITKKIYTATFDKNGASSIGSTSLSCTAYNSNTCSITTPSITISGTVIGWNTSSSATTSKIGVNKSFELSENTTLYAITKKTYTATFDKNGASSIGSTSLSCSAYNSNTCSITTPSIATSGTVIGWNTSSSATTSKIGVNKSFELSENTTLYAITKKTYTATFDKTGLDYLEASSLSCNAYNTSNSCTIKLPMFNKKGHFNSFWGANNNVSSNLIGQEWKWSYFNQVGHLYTLTENKKLYPNFNHFHYDLSKNQYKYRSINITTSINIGKSLFEFETGIPQSTINNFINTMNNVKNVLPHLFIPGKVFVMTENTYDNYSYAYGLTHNMNSSYDGDSYFNIDIQYDTLLNGIDTNAIIHELGHAWDSYYHFKTNTERISSTVDFNNFYNSIDSKLYIYDNGNKITKIETFAAMVTNYYWHVLKYDVSKGYYGLKEGDTLNTTELKQLKQFMEKYINFSLNGY